MAIGQQMTLDGTAVIVKYGLRQERHEFATAEEARGRMAIVEEATTWIGTPFRNCADVKGRQGGIDCAMLLVRCYVDTGRLPPFDPRPYPPDWFLHRREQRFLSWIEGELGARRVDVPRLGDVLIWQYGLCYSHGGIVVNNTEVVHAYGVAGMCMKSRIQDSELSKWTVRGVETDRPRLVFDVWGR